MLINHNHTGTVFPNGSRIADTVVLLTEQSCRATRYFLDGGTAQQYYCTGTTAILTGQSCQDL
jgi:hypothetical protein